jgi:hypothetical protein
VQKLANLTASAFQCNSLEIVRIIFANSCDSQKKVKGKKVEYAPAK